MNIKTLWVLGPGCGLGKARASAVLALLLTASAALPRVAAAQEPPSLPFELFELANGMTVLLHEDHALPLVAVNLWYNVGSRSERPGRSGFAHLFEHLMFMGTERVPNFDILMESGGGWNNATTSEDRTNYFSVGPSSLLETLLFLEADRMSSLDDAMTQEKVDLQRDVVRNERRQSYENAPYGKAWLIIPHALYPVGHPYYEPVIGSHQDLEAATVDDVVAFFREYYAPANLSLVVAGDFDNTKIRGQIEELFGPLPGGKRAVELTPGPPPPFVGRVETVTDNVQLARVMMVWHSPAMLQPGDAEADLVAYILSRGKNSRLFKSLVYDLQIADSVEAYQASMGLSSLFIIEATAQSGHELAELERVIDAELNKLRAEPPSQRELDRARNNLETSSVRRLESVADRADLLNAYLFHAGTADYLAQDLERYRAATPEKLRDLAREVLDPAKRFTLRIVPQAAAGGTP